MKMKRHRALLAAGAFGAVLGLTFHGSAQAANVHAGPTATGDGSGSDWNNTAAFNALSLVRGNTYYVADGGYGSRTFNTPVSGNLVITIKKATVADHGTNIGWNNALGDGVATWGSEVAFLTSNWVFDGTTRTSMTSGHGFKIQYAGGFLDRHLNFGQAFSIEVSNVTVRFVEVAGSGTEDDSVLDRGISAHCGDPLKGECNGSSNVTLHKVYVHDMGESTLHMFRVRNLTIEHSWIENNGSTATNHGGGLIVNEGVSNFVFRYNVMTRIEGTAFIETPASGHSGCAGTNQSNWYIYGNVFHEPQGGGNGTGNGVIYVFDHNHTGDFFVYNNTFVNVANAYIGAENGGDSVGCIAALTVRNNLFYNISAGAVSFGQSGSQTVARNAYWDADGIVSGSEAFVGNGTPFENWTANDFHLTSSAANAMAGGVTLGSPYSLDFAGVVRGADGKWDRGAFEFGPQTALSAPTNLRVVGN